MTRRITVEEGLRDFKESGLRPWRHVAVEREQDGWRGCLIGAMYVARGGARDWEVSTLLCQLFLEQQGFSLCYLHGLITGFDCGSNPPIDGIPRIDQGFEEYREGVLIGSEVLERFQLRLRKDTEEANTVPEPVEA